MYRSVLAGDRIAEHYRRGTMLTHRTTPAGAPRTMDNLLFPVNDVDRLLRHRMKEHTRKTIAIGRHNPTTRPGVLSAADQGGSNPRFALADLGHTLPTGL